MKNNLSLLYLSLQKRITSIQVRGKQLIAYVNHNLGQLDAPKPPISYPAVLIDFGTGNFSAMSRNTQQGVLMITLTLVFNPYSGTDNITPEKFVEMGLSYLEIEDELHRALQGWAPDYKQLITPGNPDADPPTEDVYEDLLGDIFGSLDRKSYRTDKRRSDLKIRDIMYSLGLDDFSTETEETFVPAELEVMSQIVIPSRTIEL